MRVALALVPLLLACDRLLPLGSPTSDGGLGAVDLKRLDRWSSEAPGPPDGACPLGPFGQPVVVPPFNSPLDEWDAKLSGDELSMVLKIWDNPLGQGEGDLWTARRPNKAAPFTALAALTELNSRCDDASPTLSFDGKTIYFLSRRTSSAKCGSYSVWGATRTDPSGAFSSPTPITSLPSPVVDLFLWADGETLYFSDNVGGSREIYAATRTGGLDSFGTPWKVPVINDPQSDERSPALTADGLTIYFTSDRASTTGRFDIHVATRPGPSADFSPPRLIVELKTSLDEHGPMPTADGRQLYLNYNTDLSGSSTNGADVWVATRTCLQE